MAFRNETKVRIYKPSRSVMTSGRARTKGWRMSFQRCSGGFIEPLMGWTGTDDTLGQVELGFSTLESAIRFAERHGYSYTIQPPTDDGSYQRNRLTTMPLRKFASAMLERMGLQKLQADYMGAIDKVMSSNNGGRDVESWTSPMHIVRDEQLSRDSKRALLMKWAWAKYLSDQQGEGVAQIGTRQRDIDEAILALERASPSGTGAVPRPRVA